MDTRQGKPVNRARSGQAMLEYLCIAAMVIVAMTVMGVLLYALREHGGRVLDLMSYEYP